MPLIYAKNTPKKTGFVVTEDIIPPEGGRFRPLKNNHPKAHLAVEVMTLMSQVFLNSSRTRRPTLLESYKAACALDPTIESFTAYLSETRGAAARVIVK